MACVEIWPTAETYDGENKLVLEITVPNNCYEIVSVTTQLPPGMGTDDLCNYQTGDLIATVNIQIISGCTPSGGTQVLSATTDYVKNPDGNHVQMIAYNTSNSSARTIKRSRNTSSPG